MSQHYSIRHVTTFRYSGPITESVMEVRLQPRSEGLQRCRSFALSVSPLARIHAYRDFAGNTVHHFDVPRQHAQLRVTAAALVEIRDAPPIPAAPPAAPLDPDAWAEIDRVVA